MKKYFIITGASKGLGRAMTEYLMKEQHVLFLISRTEIPELDTLAIQKNCKIHQISFDLSEVEKLPELMVKLFNQIGDDCSELYLINNAGIIDPVMPIDKAEVKAIEKIIQINYIAPVILTANFISLAEKFKIKKSILNITSGAATTPHIGMSLYGSSKAALDSFTRSVALEQNVREFPVEIHAISPGFVDTQMPGKLLKMDSSEFGSVQQFVESKNAGKFALPHKVAKKIIDLWLSGQLKHAGVSHISKY